ncbi:MAG TPA: M24 family metallopeptidase [Eoetvoesiella sp.]|uniref:M24 family metallopeptidase n=1 Tax=Eoetvoesiella sp. TaxID=1966355 RepID=UPI002C49ABFA|nr:M24 family metallopeptidase [Eoetvoesiella sp.]HWK63253.1 M24 family metallopeptidase [Eoetvoesiella sp.]
MPGGDYEVPKFSLDERGRRWARVRELMRRDGLDAIFAPPNTGMFDMFQANVRYLTGLGGNHCMVAAVFPVGGEVTAITSPDVPKKTWLARQDWVSDIRQITSGWGFTDTVIDRLKEISGLRRLGVTGLSGNTRFPEGITSHGIVERLRQGLPHVELVNANPLMEEARFIKSDEEIAFIKKADLLVEHAIDVLANEARPGVPENVVYARMLASMIEAGGEIPTMILWSAGWPQPPSNAYMPTRRPLQAGDMIQVEAEARWAGYVAQNTQPFFIGKAPDEYRRMFIRQQEAIAVCYDLLRPGETIGNLAARVASMSDDNWDCSILIHARGLGDDSPICIYAPRDNVMANWRLEENSVFIVKPQISNKDRSKRIYWGDTVVCTSSGARRLGSRPASIMELG